jgi:predicted kinase
MRDFKDFIMNESIRNILYLVRGLPGSGKSTYASKLVQAGAHFEADQYFMKGRNYVFNPSKLKDAHADCFARTRKAMMSGKYTAVAVSNTFTMKWEMTPYLDFAKEMGWEVRVIRMTGNYGSIHDVPADSIERMKKRFEPITGETMK